MFQAPFNTMSLRRNRSDSTNRADRTRVPAAAVIDITGNAPQPRTLLTIGADTSGSSDASPPTAKQQRGRSSNDENAVALPTQARPRPADEHSLARSSTSSVTRTGSWFPTSPDAPPTQQTMAMPQLTQNNLQQNNTASTQNDTINIDTVQHT